MNENMKCVSCGEEILQGAKFCHHCGADQTKEEPKYDICRKCGEEIPKGAEYCPECGTAQHVCIHCGEPLVVIDGVVSPHCPHCGKPQKKTYVCSCPKGKKYGPRDLDEYPHCPFCGKKGIDSYNRKIYIDAGKQIKTNVVNKHQHKMNNKENNIGYGEYENRTLLYLNDVSKADAIIDRFGIGGGLWISKDHKATISLNQIYIYKLVQILSLYLGVHQNEFLQGVELPEGESFEKSEFDDFDKELEEFNKTIAVVEATPKPKKVEKPTTNGIEGFNIDANDDIDEL